MVGSLVRTASGMWNGRSGMICAQMVRASTSNSGELTSCGSAAIASLVAATSCASSRCFSAFDSVVGSGAGLPAATAAAARPWSARA
jgi:hypothetical protein